MVMNHVGINLSAIEKLGARGRKLYRNFFDLGLLTLGIKNGALPVALLFFFIFLGKSSPHPNAYFRGFNSLRDDLKQVLGLDTSSFS